MCGPLDDVPPDKLLTGILAFSEFMPPDAPHGPALDALWNAYRRYAE